MAKKKNDLTALVGMQLVNLTKHAIMVKKNGKTFQIHIDDDEGDCCGFNEISTRLYFKPNSKRNPVITSVVQKSQTKEVEETCNVIFFGEDKTIAELDTLSSSGSGWGYGATVSVKCDKLDIDDVLSSW